MPLCHLCVFFGKNVYWRLLPILWIGFFFYFLFFFGMQLYQNCWYILDINLLLAVHLWIVLSVQHFFLVSDGFCAKAFMCNLVSFFVLFNFFCIKQMNQEVVPPFMSEIPMFSYISSMVLYLTLDFKIILSLECSVTLHSRIIFLLHVAFQLSQYHLKRWSFLHCIVLPPL